MKSTHYSCHTLLKLEFSRQVFEKYSNVKFHENPLHWDPTGRRMDERTDVGKDGVTD